MVKCAIIGCGLMGCKIAGDLALHGHRVKMYDSDIVILNSVCERIKEDKKELLREGLLTQSVFSGSILCMSRLDECIDDADFIFEVVSDDLDVKAQILEEISKLAAERTIICSNTLRLNINRLCDYLKYKERFLGIRFLYPVYFIPEVEVSLSEHTSQKTLNLVRGLLEAMGKTLFFRSGKEPLILTDEQREYRKECRHTFLSDRLIQVFIVARQEMWKTDGIATRVCQVPELAASYSEGQWSSLGDARGLSNSMTALYNPPSSGECAICLDNPRDCLLEPCRHLILCQKCASMLLSRNDYCPMCRSQIQSTGGVYLS